MTMRTVRFDIPCLGYSAGDVTVLDDAVPLYAGLIARGSLSLYTPPVPGVVLPNPNSEVRLAELSDPASAASLALRAAFVGQGGNTFSGTQAGPFLEIDNGSQQASLHLVTVPGFTGPYAAGIGINADNAKGLVLDATNPGTMGAQVTLFPGTDANSYGISGQNQGPGKLVSLAQQGTGSMIGPALHIESQGVAAAGQILLRVQVDALAGTSAFGADVLMVRADTGVFDFTGPVTRYNGGRLTVQGADLTGANNVHRVDINGATAPSLDLHAYAGSPNAYFSTSIASHGQTAALRGTDGAPAIGSESWLDALTWGVVSGNRVLGFFGAPAVAKPTGTPAAATDAATTQALVNSLRASLISLGLVA